MVSWSVGAPDGGTTEGYCADPGAVHDKKEKDADGVKVACTCVDSTCESTESLSAQPPQPHPQPHQRERVTTWGNDSVSRRRSARQWDWRAKARWKVRWTWVLHDACLGLWNAMKWLVKTVKNAAVWKQMRWSKKQFYAFCLMAVWVIVPMTLIGYLTPFTSIFADKTLSCGNGVYGQPQNATVTGIEKLFALDATFGRFSFSQVKAIDVLWDLVVGKGAQALAWWASYTVFCDALLRAIERHPASFEIFQRIANEGPGLLSLWTLIKELWNAKSARTRALFFYMFWSTGYVLLVPIVLGAMTGYDATSIAWIDLQGENNIIPASALHQTWVVAGTKNETFKAPACVDYNLRSAYDYMEDARDHKCDCQFPNGTIATADERWDWYRNSYYYYNQYLSNYDTCSFAYPNNTQTWTDPSSHYYVDSAPFYRPDNTYACNATFSITIANIAYDASTLNGSYGYCYNDVGYDYTLLSDKSRCLPDTADPSYAWGFATLMSGLFIFVTAIWTLSMYILWQDAQFNCGLVKRGYRLTPLRAAFAMAVAARRRTGLGGKELVRVGSEGLERELYGGRGTRGTLVEGHLFVESVEDEACEEEKDGDGRVRKQGMSTTTTPLSPLSPTYASPGKERYWPESPASIVGEHEIRPLVRSDTDVSFHVLDDEELRKRYLRGVEEARLSRKPLSRESTWIEESMWDGGSPRLPRYEERSPDGGADGVGSVARDEKRDMEVDGYDERHGKGGKKERARLKKSRRDG